MPYRFTFRINQNEHFASNLTCSQCSEQTRNTVIVHGQAQPKRCTRNTCIGTGVCFQHLRSMYHLRVGDSPIAGKGLFAVDPNNTPNEVVFEKDDPIIKYNGQRISKTVLDNRYTDDYTAPYGVLLRRLNENREHMYEDGATKRGIGTLVNHAVTYPQQGARRANAMFQQKQPNSITNNHIILVAICDIHHNEEILVNYGRDYRFNQNTDYNTMLGG